MKNCTKCEQEKPLSEFHRDASKKSGYRPICKDCVKQYRHRYYLNNSGVEITRNSAYAKTNPHVQWECDYRRRSVKFGFEPVVVSFTKEELIERWGDACVDCKGEWNQTEHVIPISSGGSHTLENVQPICQKCNNARWWAYKRANQV